MGAEKTILAGYFRPVRIRIVEGIDQLSLTVNRITGARYTTYKRPINLLNEMPSLKIAKNAFFANAKAKLTVNSRFEVQSTAELFKAQSAFLRQMVEENKEKIKNRASEKYENRYRPPGEK